MIKDVVFSLIGLWFLTLAVSWAVIWGVFGLLGVWLVHVADGDREVAWELYQDGVFGFVEWVGKTFY